MLNFLLMHYYTRFELGIGIVEEIRIYKNDAVLVRKIRDRENRELGVDEDGNPIKRVVKGEICRIL